MNSKNKNKKRVGKTQLVKKTLKGLYAAGITSRSEVVKLVNDACDKFDALIEEAADSDSDVDYSTISDFIYAITLLAVAGGKIIAADQGKTDDTDLDLGKKGRAAYKRVQQFTVAQMLSAEIEKALSGRVTPRPADIDFKYRNGRLAAMVMVVKEEAEDAEK